MTGRGAWKRGRIQEEWDNILKYLYENGSVPYKKFRARFAFSLGISLESADRWLQTLIDSELIERKGEEGQEVVLTKEGYEYIANKIFHAKSRTLWESITTYWTMLTLTPIALGASFYITGYIATLMASNSLTSGLNILPLIPYIIIWALFFLLFQISANTKINPKASLISSFLISVVFSISKNAFIYYVFLNKSYTTMYGSFAILMFLFLWIYVSWIIFIYGLKLCHIINRVYENRETKTK